MHPAAVPLGTDDEAAGTPTKPEAIRQAYAHEIGSRVGSSERKADDHAVAIYSGLILTIAAVIILASWLL